MSKGRGPLWATIHLLLTHFYDEFCFLFFVCDNFPIRSTPATDVIRCQSYKHSTTVIYDSNVAPNVKFIELTMAFIGLSTGGKQSSRSLNSNCKT